MIDHILVYISVLAAVIACGCCCFVLWKSSAAARAAGCNNRPAAKTEETSWEPPSPTQPLPGRSAIRGAIEGIEMNLDKGGVVKRARIAAMNDEHRELVLVVNGNKWVALSAAARQQAAIAARSTWAAKVCDCGPDVAYVTIVTDGGDILAQADPHSVRIR